MTLDIRSFAIGIAAVLGLLTVGFGTGVMMGGVISGNPKPPSKVERQAAKEVAAREENKPALAPVVVTPAQADAKPAAPPDSTPAAPPAIIPQPQPVQTATPTQPASPELAQAAAQPQPPSLGAQRPVALTQPSDEVRPLSRREEARLRTQQRREERAQRREERRQQMAERRQQEFIRREQERAARQPDEDDDDDARPALRERPPEMRPPNLFDGLFRSFR